MMAPGGAAPNPTATDRRVQDPDVARLLQPMLKRSLFVAITEPVPGGPPISDHLLAHLESQIALEKAGMLVAAGPLAGADGKPRGMWVLRCADRDEAIRVLDADPLHQRGCHRYQLHQWQVNEGRISITVDFSDQSVVLG